MLKTYWYSLQALHNANMATNRTGLIAIAYAAQVVALAGVKCWHFLINRVVGYYCVDIVGLSGLGLKTWGVTHKCDGVATVLQWRCNGYATAGCDFCATECDGYLCDGHATAMRRKCDLVRRECDGRANFVGLVATSRR